MIKTMKYLVELFMAIGGVINAILHLGLTVLVLYLVLALITGNTSISVKYYNHEVVTKLEQKVND